MCPEQPFLRGGRAAASAVARSSRCRRAHARMLRTPAADEAASIENARAVGNGSCHMVCCRRGCHAGALHASQLGSQGCRHEDQLRLLTTCLRRNCSGARRAQPAERKALNLVVVGSSPTVGGKEGLGALVKCLWFTGINLHVYSEHNIFFCAQHIHTSMEHISDIV